tara:strand:- start:1422 stop:1637 length:216 start_codon:yes stop_codon:yes gene_type:complete
MFSRPLTWWSIPQICFAKKVMHTDHCVMIRYLFFALNGKVKIAINEKITVSRIRQNSKVKDRIRIFIVIMM